MPSPPSIGPAMGRRTGRSLGPATHPRHAHCAPMTAKGPAKWVGLKLKCLESFNRNFTLLYLNRRSPDTAPSHPIWIGITPSSRALGAHSGATCSVERDGRRASWIVRGWRRGQSAQAGREAGIHRRPANACPHPLPDYPHPQAVIHTPSPTSPNTSEALILVLKGALKALKETPTVLKMTFEIPHKEAC